MTKPRDDERMLVSSRHAHHRCLLHLLQQVLAHKEGPMRVHALASVAGFSRAHLTRVCQTHLNESPADLERRLRLERSAYGIRQLGHSVAEAAREAGYATPEAYSRTFRTAYGILPSAFRRATTIDWRLECASDVHWSPEGRLRKYTLFQPGDGQYAVLERPATTMVLLGQVENWSRFSLADALSSAKLPSELRETQGIRPAIIYLNVKRSAALDAGRVEFALEWPKAYLPPPDWRTISIPPGVFAVTSHSTSPEMRQEVWLDMAHQWLPNTFRRGQCPVILEQFDGWPSAERVPRSRMLVGLDLGISVA